MPRVRDVLYRFRPAGAPGAASSAGVPVDRSADLAAELEPVFALLADTEQEVCRLYDVIQEKIVDGHPKSCLMRSTYVIDKKGVVRHIHFGYTPSFEASSTDANAPIAPPRASASLLCAATWAAAAAPATMATTILTNTVTW